LVFVILPVLLIIFSNNSSLFHFAHEKLKFGDFDNISRQLKRLRMCLVSFGSSYQLYDCYFFFYMKYYD